MPKQWVASQCFCFILGFSLHWSSVIKIGFPFWKVTFVSASLLHWPSFYSHSLPKCKLSLEAFWLVAQKSTREDYLNPKEKSSLLQFKSNLTETGFFCLLMYSIFSKSWWWAIFTCSVVFNVLKTDFKISYIGRKEKRVVWSKFKDS